MHHNKVRAALEWKIANDPHYSNLKIDEEVLADLPVRGSVANRVPWVPEQENNLNTVRQGPNDAAGQGSTDKEDVDKQLVMGVVDAEGVRGTEAQEIRRGAAEVIVPREAPYQ